MSMRRTVAMASETGQEGCVVFRKSNAAEGGLWQKR
jgi:hypothetical protein